eukprot:Nitzschia sp. Nitz4//scaffold44_size153857//115497//119767//NITZ4_002740-RA/size153857-augustus-gene-0.10-mRNA-1//1//CDS//3329552214//4855//frame0
MSIQSPLAKETARILPPTSSEWFWKGETPSELTCDFVIRSLRRRLYKALQDDDVPAVRRAYTATLSDLQVWLQEEQQARQDWPPSLLHDTTNGSDATTNNNHNNSSTRARPRRASLKERTAGMAKPHARSRSVGSDILASQQQSDQPKPGTAVRRKSTASRIETTKSSTLPWHHPPHPSLSSSQLDRLPEGPILLSQMNPSDPFIADDYLSPYDMSSYQQPARKELPDVAKYEREKLDKQRRRQLQPRLRIFGFRDESTATDASVDEISQPPNQPDEITSTTPLHEVARLGDSTLLSFFLSNQGDPNVRNGMGRTALHMVSGGITREEERLWKSCNADISLVRKGTDNISSTKDGVPIGIRPPDIPTEVFALMKKERRKKSDKGTARKAALAMGRLMASWGVTKSPMKNNSSNTSKESKKVSKVSKKKQKEDAILWKTTQAERSASVEALLSWINPNTGEGPSINAVDADGRTALHYAAELGRADTCISIASVFGTMLTIIDEVGARTPCELAGAQGHKDLAALLEARALLYIDPYGVEEELLTTMLRVSNRTDQDDPRSALVGPFSWYDTIRSLDVATERSTRIATAKSKLLKAIQDLDNAQNRMEESCNSTGNPFYALGYFPGEDQPSDEDNAEKKKARAKSKSNSDSSSETAEQPSNSEGEENKSITQEKACAEKKDKKPSLVRDFGNLRESDVERFLVYHKWNVTEAIAIFKKDPRAAFEKAGIVLPPVADEEEKEEEETSDRVCLICYDDEVGEEDWVELGGCVHGFCSDCLKGYLGQCAASKMPKGTITCPHHDCNVVIAAKQLKELLQGDNESAERIEEATCDQFIATANDFAFCPHPGCQGVVQRLPQSYLVKKGVNIELANFTGAVCTAIRDQNKPPTPSADNEEDASEEQKELLTYEGVVDPTYFTCDSNVQPRKAHRFCLVCGKGPHWPVPCERLDEWKEKVQEQIGEVKEKGRDGSDEHYNELAQKLWLKANTRPCPQCKVPIEKNEGCNHMICFNPACRHEFCWICRRDWSLHGSSTGGFFRCNIWEEGQKPPDSPAFRGESSDEGYGTAIHSAREAYYRRQEMARFVHHYTRWEAHDESGRLERKIGDSVCSRLAPVVKAAKEFDGSPSFNFGGKGLSFVHAAFTELLECRSVLKHSYAFSFFRYGQGVSGRRREKMSFERLQSELEMMTEQMSDIVARSHLRATQMQISFLTAGAAEKREDFSNLMLTILNTECKEKKYEEKKSGAELIARRASSRRNPFSALSGTLRQAMNDTWPSDDDDDIFVEGHRGRRGGGVAVPHAIVLDMDEMGGGGDGRGGGPGVRMWECNLCTYMNTDGGRQCAMCGNLRRLL